MTSIARDALKTRSTWLGPELLTTQDDWIRRLNVFQIADLENALVTAKASGKSMTELRRDDFPLPVLAPAIAEWMDALQNGRGFINVKAIPVSEQNEEDIGLIHWGLGDLLLYPVVHLESPTPSSSAEAKARTNGAARPDRRDCRRPGLSRRNASRAWRDQLSREQRCTPRAHRIQRLRRARTKATPGTPLAHGT